MTRAKEIKLLIQKRSSLKSQITTLKNLVDAKSLEKSNMQLRMERLTELYKAFENSNDELAILDPDNDHQTEFENLQEKFFNLASEIKIILTPPPSSASIGTDNMRVGQSNETLTTPRQFAIPKAALPKFDGQYEKWLSFKNTFKTMIDSQSGMSNAEKLYHLQNALVGEAADKIGVFELLDANYDKAWNLLTESYEAKRIIISRHCRHLLNLPVQERESKEGLNKLTSEMRQHVGSLETLGVQINSEMLVTILESKLHKFTAKKWEESLERDQFPTINEMLEFLNKVAVHASMHDKRERSKLEAPGRDQPFNKRRRFNNSEPQLRTLAIHTSNNCPVCKNQQHPLWRCEAFRSLPTRERLNTVRSAKFCILCLRRHPEQKCNYRGCKECGKSHNILLHLGDTFKGSKKEKQGPTVATKEELERDTEKPKTL